MTNNFTKNCECCDKGYSSGKEYGDFGIPNAVEEDGNGGYRKVKQKGLCPMCNSNSEYFCCKKHGLPFKIGNFWYRPENNFEKSND